jgi:XTP/dITP diphosphohydrolase
MQRCSDFKTIDFKIHHSQIHHPPFTNLPLTTHFMQNKLAAFERLLNIMDELREKCPWDRKQTLESLRILTIEEVYELGDAILKNDTEELKSELGDIMLHLVFYSKIASEQGRFDVADVLNTVCEKLIHRHPHIYGDVVAADEETVKKNWEQLKLKEGRKSVLEGVPRGLPAMVKAFRIQDKTAQVGFGWDKAADVWEKVQEETQELQAEVQAPHPDKDKIEAEFGDVFFSLINYARFLGIDPETALERTNQKFINRFAYIEKNAPRSLSDMSLAEMDALWNEAKKI